MSKKMMIIILILASAFPISHAKSKKIKTGQFTIHLDNKSSYNVKKFNFKYKMHCSYMDGYDSSAGCGNNNAQELTPILVGDNSYQMIVDKDGYKANYPFYILNPSFAFYVKAEHANLYEHNHSVDTIYDSVGFNYEDIAAPSARDQYLTLSGYKSFDIRFVLKNGTSAVNYLKSIYGEMDTIRIGYQYKKISNDPNYTYGFSDLFRTFPIGLSQEAFGGNFEDSKTNNTMKLSRSKDAVDQKVIVKVSVRLETDDWKELGWERSYKYMVSKTFEIHESEIANIANTEELGTFIVDESWDIKNK